MRPSILLEVFEERQKQIAKRYDAAHDDQYTTELVDASTYLIARRGGIDTPDWADDLFQKHRDDYRKRLIIAMALLWAEIDRLDRNANA